jgi:hypothetical protein
VLLFMALLVDNDVPARILPRWYLVLDDEMSVDTANDSDEMAVETASDGSRSSTGSAMSFEIEYQDDARIAGSSNSEWWHSG